MRNAIRARQNPVGAIGILALGALASLYLIAQTRRNLQGAVKTSAEAPDKSGEEIAQSLATVEGAVQVTPAPGVTVTDTQELTRKGATYMDVVVEFVKRQGAQDPQGDIRGVTVLKPTVGKVFVLNSHRFRVGPNDRLLAVNSLVQGSVFYLLTPTRPPDWPYADWQYRLYPIPLGSQLHGTAGTRDQTVAVPLRAASRAVSTIDTSSSAIPNCGYLGWT